VDPGAPLARIAAAPLQFESGTNWHYSVAVDVFWVDPAERLALVALTNTAVAGMFGAFPSALQRAVYPA
jgi:hypothetical protein